MRNRIRLALLAAAAAALVLVVMLAALAGDGGPYFSHLAGWVIIGSVMVAWITAIAMLIWVGASRASSAAGADLGLVESRLASIVMREAARTDSLALHPAGRGHRVNIQFDKVTSGFRDYGGGATGDLASVAEYFTSLSPARMVVLGGPGSGKTILALELQVQLLELKLTDRGQASPVPVLVSAASCDIGKAWASWLAGHLAERYPFAAGAATRLVIDGRILPVIDGIDELGQAGAAALIAELNTFIRERESSGSGGRPSVVITCREGEYQDLAESLDEATHVKVRPLATEDVRAYLRKRGVEVPDALAPVLDRPFMLSMADTVYRAGADSGQSVEDLLRLPDETAVERHLLAAFLENAYRPGGRGRSWSPAQAERWLAVIGSQLRALSAEGYAWRQVAYAMPSGLLGVLSGAATGLGLLAAVTLLGVIHQVFGERMSLGPAIGSLAAVSIAPAVVVALLVSGISSGWLLSWATTAMPLSAVSLPMGFVTLTVPRQELRQELRSGLLRQRQGEGSSAASPHADLIQSRKRALMAAALRLVGGHVSWDAAIVLVCYCMVAVVLCGPWGSFQVARAWFSARNELPFRLMSFLEDAHGRGILLSVGPRFEFRNYAVREYFSDPARLPEVRREIGELTDWALGNPEIRESYAHVGADRSDIEQAVSSLATETILAGQPFAADAATRQAALERVRVRLNELGRRSAFRESLVAREAPGLGAVTDPSRVILTRTMYDLARLIDRIPSASVGISGIRGIGKSTLIRWLCTERNADGRLPALGIYVIAPVEYDARDFLVHLFITLCKAVLADDRLADHRARQHRSAWQAALAVILAVAGVGAYYHRIVGRDLTVGWAHHQGYLWSAAVSVLLTTALFVLVSVIDGMRHGRGGGRRRTSLEATARDRLQHLRYQVVETTGQTGNLTGPLGLSFSGSRSRQVTENQMTLPELVESYREFAGLTVSALQESARRDGPLAIAQVRLIVGIDEIDRIEDAGNAEKFLNDIKAIFGIPNCFYVASLSADALANFERRVVSTRTAFDTTFDTVMRIGPLELATARQVLERRAIGLPYPFITLCYALSGGVPRELMRIARGIFDVRNDAQPGPAGEGAVACTVIAPRVIAREMESLRQGLMPLATQLSVPGAAELIGLLDDPDWPSWDTPQDLARLGKVIGQRTLFLDEAGSISAAARICDGLAAASYFFLSVDELFRTRLDKIITDLKRYDAAPDRDADLAASIHLLARARAAIGVNPALAVARVQAARKSYGLPDIAPVLLSSLPPDSGKS